MGDLRQKFLTILDEAVFYHQQGRLDEAFSRYQSAITIGEQLCHQNNQPWLVEYQNYLAVAHSNCAVLLSSIGKVGNALVHYQSAIALYELVLDSRHPNNLDYQYKLATTYENRADLLRKIGALDEAIINYQSSITLREQLRNSHRQDSQPWLVELQIDLATAYAICASLFNNVGKSDESISYYQSAIAVGTQLHGSCHTNNWSRIVDFQNDLVGSYINCANLLITAGKRADALMYFKSAIDICERLRDNCYTNNQPWRAEYQYSLYGAFRNCANLLLESDKRDEALAYVQSAIIIGEQLRNNYNKNNKPRLVQHLHDLAIVYSICAVLLGDTNRLEEALICCRSAITVSEELREFCDKNNQLWSPNYQEFLADAYSNCAILLKNTDKLEEALILYRSAIAHRENLHEYYNRNNQSWLLKHQKDLANTYSSCANLSSATGRSYEALALYQSAIIIGEQIRDSCKKTNEPWLAEYQHALATTYISCSVLLGATGRHDEALTHDQSAISIGEQLRDSCHKNNQPWLANYQNALAIAYTNRAVVLRVTGKSNEALEHYQSAMIIGEQLRDSCHKNNEPWLDEYQNLLAGVYSNCAVLMRTTGNQEEASKYYRSAITLRENLRDSCHKKNQVWPLGYQNDLAVAYFNWALLFAKENELIKSEKASDLFEKSAHVIQNLLERLDKEMIIGSIEYIESYLLIWNVYFSYSNFSDLQENFSPVLKVLLRMLEDYSAATDASLSKTYKELATKIQSLLINVFVRCIKENDYALALKALNSLQARNISFQLSELTLDNSAPDEAKTYVSTRQAFQPVRDEAILNPKRLNELAFKEQFTTMLDAYNEARRHLMAIPKYAAQFEPHTIDIAELQSGLGAGEATLLWVSLTATEEAEPITINGIFYIPPEGSNPHFLKFDENYLDGILDLQKLLAHYLGGRGNSRKGFMPLSVEDLNLLKNKCACYNPKSSDEQNINNLWGELSRRMRKLWQHNDLNSWFEADGITKIIHCTQGDAHNLTVSLSSPDRFSHRYLPGVALLRIKALHAKENPYTAFNAETFTFNSIVDDGGTYNPIDFVNLEQQLLNATFENVQVGLVNEKNPYPWQALANFLHIACHGQSADHHLGAALQLGDLAVDAKMLMQYPPQAQILFIDACIAGLTDDDHVGEPDGLLISLLLNKSVHKVIASTLPIADDLAAYLALLFFTELKRGKLNIEATLHEAKQQLLAGMWSAEAIDVLARTVLSELENLYRQKNKENQQDRKKIINLLRASKDNTLGLEPSWLDVAAGNVYSNLTADATREDILTGISNAITAKAKSIATNEIGAGKVYLQALINSLQVFG